MSRLTIIFVLSIVGLFYLPLSAQQDATELIQSHQQAVNPDALSNAHSLKWVGTETINVNQPGSAFELLQAPEGKWKTTRTISEVTVTETFNGEQGWVSSSAGGRGSTNDFQFENPTTIARMSQWGSLLAKAEQYGYEPEYLGQLRDGGSMVHEFRMTGKNYDGFMLYLGANTNMVTKIRDQKIIKGRQESVEVHYGDYREVEGAMLPFRIETIRQGETISIVQFETVEINPEIAADTWTKQLSDREKAIQRDGGRG